MYIIFFSCLGGLIEYSGLTAYSDQLKNVGDMEKFGEVENPRNLLPVGGNNEKTATDGFLRMAKRGFRDFHGRHFPLRSTAIRKRTQNRSYLEERSRMDKFPKMNVIGMEFVGKRFPGTEFVGKRTPDESFGEQWGPGNAVFDEKQKRPSLYLLNSLHKKNI